MRKQKYKFRKRKMISKRMILFIFIAILVCISYGYGLLTSQLTISGTASGEMGNSFGDAKTTPGTDYVYTVGTTGWYALQAWGGNGGASGALTIGIRSNSTQAAVAGGIGGYVSCYVYLTKGQAIKYTIGAAGTDGDDYSSTGVAIYRTAYGEGGGAGNQSIIYVDNTTYLIAGGGGGTGRIRRTYSIIGIKYICNGNNASTRFNNCYRYKFCNNCICG